MADETLLVITGLSGVQPYSARGLSVSLTPIAAAASYRRTINGTLRNLALEQFQKYKAAISGDDVAAPAMDLVWPGALVTVEFPVELSYATGTVGAPGRDVASGSSYTDGGFTFYRPVMDMMVTDFQQDAGEYSSQYRWSLALEEV